MLGHFMMKPDGRSENENRAGLGDRELARANEAQPQTKANCLHALFHLVLPPLEQFAQEGVVLG